MAASEQPGGIAYRKIDRLKYQLVAPYWCHTDIPIVDSIAGPNEFVCMGPGGALRFKVGYAWNGASGPGIDTKNTMRGTLVHDGLYQLMSQSLLSLDYRDEADDIMRRLFIADGMWKARARWMYWAVRKFGRPYARPKDTLEPLTAP